MPGAVDVMMPVKANVTGVLHDADRTGGVTTACVVNVIAVTCDELFRLSLCDRNSTAVAITPAATTRAAAIVTTGRTLRVPP